MLDDAPQLRALPVLDEDAAPWAGRDRWPQALSDLVTRRAERSGALLRQSVPDVDGKLDKVLRGLAATGETMTALAHGDLIPGTILVDDGLHPWPFSTAGSCPPLPARHSAPRSQRPSATWTAPPPARPNAASMRR